MTKELPDSTSPATKGDVSRLEGGISRLSNRLDTQFEKINKRFDRIDDRFEQVDERFDSIDKQMKVDSRRTASLLMSVANLEDNLQHVSRVAESTARNVKTWSGKNDIVLTDHEKRLRLR